MSVPTKQTLETREFVSGAILKTCGLGALVAAVSGFLAGPWFGWSVAVGAGLAAANLAALAELSRRMFAGVADDSEAATAAFWGVLLAGKVGLLIALALVALAVFDVDGFALFVGYTTFVVATGWQVFESFDV